MAGRKGAVVARGTVFVLAVDMVTADKWAAAVGLSKDRYRYVVNPSVFDVMGKNDSYGYVEGFREHPHYTDAMSIVRERDLPWCERDPDALNRTEQGLPVRSYP